MPLRFSPTSSALQTLLRAGCVSAALALSGCMLHCADAEARGAEAGLARAAQKATLHCIAAIPAAPNLDGQDNFAQRVVWVSLIRRLIVLIRTQAIPAGIAAALEETANALAKRFPREKLHGEVCFGLDSLKELAVDNRIKPDARAALLELVAELKQVSGCHSPQAAQR
jgi:hypothetical protein